MTHSTPQPSLLDSGPEVDWGLICGYRFADDGRPREISGREVTASLERDDAVTWLHFNLSDVRARRWLVAQSFLPADLRELLQTHDENRRFEAVDDGLVLVLRDFTYEHASDPSDVATLWCYADPQLLVTARLHALRSSDDLRLQVRNGAGTVSGLDLMAQLLELRTGHLRRLAHEMMEQLDDIEDEILAGSIKQQREQLGRMRRLCARLRRQFAPERADLSKLLNRPSTLLGATDREALQSAVEGLGFAIEEIAEIYERAKLLQEELASRLAENTGRNLYVLSILTAVLLPMTLVTGIFGMNVPDLPGVHGPGSFWHVMLLIVVSGAVTLAALFWRRLL